MVSAQGTGDQITAEVHAEKLPHASQLLNQKKKGKKKKKRETVGILGGKKSL